MEQRPSDRSRDESWSSPAQEEYKPSRAKRSRNRRKNGRPTTAVQFEIEAPSKEGSPVILEATIWERPSPEQNAENNPVATVSTPPKKESIRQEPRPPERDAQKKPDPAAELPMQQYVSAPELPAPDMQKPAPSLVTAEDRQWVDDFASAPETTHAYAPQPTPDHVQVSIQGGEPNAQRSYFWTEPDIRQPNQTAIEHDMLPPVLPALLSEQVAPASGLKPTVLEQAVNPNIVAEEIAGHAAAQRTQEEANQPRSSGISSFVSPAANLLARRRTRGGVKSQPMKPNSFEQPSPFSANFEDAGTIPAPVEFSIPESVPEQFGQAEQNEANIRPPFAPVEAPEHPERLGHMLVAAEQSNSPEQTAIHTTASPEQRMQQAELSEMAKTIHIDGVSVYEMFTAKRIDEEGLHRIVVEYLRGGDIKKMIASEVMRQQIKFERDPQLRSVPVAVPEKPRSSGRVKEQAKSLLDLERTIDRTERLADFTQKEVEKAQHYFRTNPRMATVASIVSIAVIYSLILIIALSK